MEKRQILSRTKAYLAEAQKNPKLNDETRNHYLWLQEAIISARVFAQIGSQTRFQRSIGILGDYAKEKESPESRYLDALDEDTLDIIEHYDLEIGKSEPGYLLVLRNKLRGIKDRCLARDISARLCA